MTAKFDKLLGEDLNLPEATRVQIKEAWDSQINEAKEELTSTLREEFAQKFEHDKVALVESMDKFLNEQVRTEIAEFAQDKKDLAVDRVKYKTGIKEHAKLLDGFITEQLSTEVKELRAEKQTMRENVRKLEGFLLEQLSKEIREFKDDKEALVQQRVKIVKEGKNALVQTKRKFISKAAKVIEENINNILRKEISQYRNDIVAARENDFGRRIYESFVAEYMTSYLNEGSEVAKLQRVITQKENELTEAKAKVGSQKAITESTQSKLNAAKDRIDRQQTMHELLAPLSTEKRTVMKELLESVKTDKLRAAYNKYLPAVINESVQTRAKGKASLNESMRVAKTGDRAQASLDKTASFDDLEKIKILAGIK